MSYPSCLHDRRFPQFTTARFATLGLDATGTREAVPEDDRLLMVSMRRLQKRSQIPWLELSCEKKTTIQRYGCVQACVVESGEDIASGGNGMLWTIFVILLVLWLVGLVSSYTLGGFIHLLLVAAVVVLILQLISGRRPVV